MTSVDKPSCSVKVKIIDSGMNPALNSDLTKPYPVIDLHPSPAGELYKCIKEKEMGSPDNFGRIAVDISISDKK